VTDEKIQIKGVSEGLLVTVRNLPWIEVNTQIISKIDISPDFYKGAKIILDVGELSLKAIELGKLRDTLSERGISLSTVISNSSVTLTTAEVLGLSTKFGVHQIREKQIKSSNFFEGDSAVWVEKTLRAGYKVETKCHVVVLGDVNPGAEIISAGNIMVWGRLSGSVHAGVDGNANAKVMALELEPTGLQINQIAASPINKKKKSQPEIAFILENQIIIEGWNIKKNRRGAI
jgi:septum site-determining protein MinC